ncbi:MAG: hypothetical protein RLZZ210_164 [Pseudomonadota bacterium]|jgi:hypothetical protein
MHNNPTINSKSFNCPHCNVFTSHTYYSCNGNILQGIPNLSQTLVINNYEAERLGEKYSDEITILNCKILNGKLFITKAELVKNTCLHRIYNLNISECYACKEITVWVHDKIVFPKIKFEILPNEDLPDNVKELFNEAREIVHSSPRGATALLRLCVEYLCQHFGENGKNLNDSIASLVKKGLDPKIQKALDIVRVIGNEAVHAGEINLSDNIETAYSLFDIINIIAKQMITNHKEIENMYQKLPNDKLKAIEKRDNKN